LAAKRLKISHAPLGDPPSGILIFQKEICNKARLALFRPMSQFCDDSLTVRRFGARGVKINRAADSGAKL
jgi:hypothetical protein